MARRLAAAAVIAAAAAAIVPLIPAILHPGTASTPAGGQPAAAAAAKAPPAGGVPVRLRIPAIGVFAPVESVGRTPEGNIDVPRDVNDVGWYAEGVAPGQPGDAVIDGHLDWYTGPAVFAHLDRVRIGDLVEVDLAGGGVRFQVDRIATYPYDRPPAGLASRAGPARLTLIVCAGWWNGRTYTRRLVVDGALVGRW